MDIDTQVLKGHIDTIILSLLCKQDMYGYDIANAVRKRSHGKFEIKEGTMYLSLKRMEKNELIESYWGGTEGGGARRKYYRILESGQRFYRYKKREWSYLKSVLDTFLEEG
ncbi:PadR family transcriptional regulator [Alicyclobacillus fastidiosus]|uniref:PadR family transcriptional regulator n=2 Tax=Alicyclobacillus TaxID=29330 RepID=A0ABY6ZI89_9BACL|nr:MULTISPECIES: PadR family transcriptional regulator [Alicyclobacillus]WAH42318.1 PadR family transcriptional regulator [Alicyclobacillus fastidiosus]GMA64126.1 PadR family transcriptional regulator [Alicyclobacillus fastidiosus]SHK98985.1 DNA-binding transcriptional regulator, PadR family [Alicyclobacillus montanus]